MKFNENKRIDIVLIKIFSNITIDRFIKYDVGTKDLQNNNNCPFVGLLSQ